MADPAFFGCAGANGVGATGSPDRREQTVSGLIEAGGPGSLRLTAEESVWADATMLKIMGKFV